MITGSVQKGCPEWLKYSGQQNVSKAFLRLYHSKPTPSLVEAQMGLLVNDVETRVCGSKGSKVQVGQQELDTSPISDEVVVEAEEEVLPVVIRAGHIRFEPYDIGMGGLY